MRLEDAKRIKLMDSSGNSKYYNKDELALLIYQWAVDYKYVPKSARRGILELYNDAIDVVFNCYLYDQ